MEAINIFNVCSFFVGKGLEVGRPITQIKLQKLLYFAQGAHLSAYNGIPLFGDRLFAWKYGPVVQEVYHIFKAFGNNPMTAATLDQHYPGGADYFLNRKEAIDQEETEFLEEIWAIFGKYSAFELVELTHVIGSPWYSLFSHYEGNIPHNTEISRAEMQKYFTKLLMN